MKRSTNKNVRTPFVVGRGLAPAGLLNSRFCNGGTKAPPYKLDISAGKTCFMVGAHSVLLFLLQKPYVFGVVGDGKADGFGVFPRADGATEDVQVFKGDVPRGAGRAREGVSGDVGGADLAARQGQVADGDILDHALADTPAGLVHVGDLHEILVGAFRVDIFVGDVADHRVARVVDGDDTAVEFAVLRLAVDHVHVAEENIFHHRVVGLVADLKGVAAGAVPENAILHQNVAHVKALEITGDIVGGLDADAVVLVFDKQMAQQDLLAAHDVNAVRPYLVGEDLDVFHRHATAVVQTDVPTVVVDDRHAVDLHVLAAGEVDGVVTILLGVAAHEHAAAQNAYVAGAFAVDPRVKEHALADIDHEIGYRVDSSCLVVTGGGVRHDGASVVKARRAGLVGKQKKGALYIAVDLKAVIIAARQGKGDGAVALKAKGLASSGRAQGHGRYGIAGGDDDGHRVKGGYLNEVVVRAAVNGKGTSVDRNGKLLREGKGGRLHKAPPRFHYPHYTRGGAALSMRRGAFWQKWWIFREN